MVAYTKDWLRLAFYLDNPDKTPINRMTSRAPAVWDGTNWRIDIAGYYGDALVNVANWASLTLYVKAYQAWGSAALITGGPISIFDNTLDDASWDDCTKQHARFELTSAQTTVLDLGAESKKTFSLIIKGEASGGDVFMVGTSTLIVRASGL